MGAVTVHAAVHVSGPLADGSAHQAVTDWLAKTRSDVAGEGLAQLRAVVMDKTGRATGHYQAELQATTLASGDILLHDPVVYGPWLEGTSERNRSTRFKGYRLWRKTRERLQERAPQVAEENLRLFIGRMGGTP